MAGNSKPVCRIKMVHFSTGKDSWIIQATPPKGTQKYGSRPVALAKAFDAPQEPRKARRQAALVGRLLGIPVSR